MTVRKPRSLQSYAWSFRTDNMVRCLNPYIRFCEIRPMRVVFVASFLANLFLALSSLALLPDRVAIHFGPGGVPNGWATNLAGVILVLGVHCLVFFSLYLAPGLLAKVPAKWINLPNRDFWLRPEHRAQAMALFAQHLWRFGTVLFLFMLLAGLLTLKANLSEPVRLDERALLLGLAGFLAYTLFWVVALLRAFRIPRDTDD